MTAPTFSPLSKAIILGMLVLMVCGFVIGARQVVRAYDTTDLMNVSTPTHATFYSVVELIKPTYTFTPLPTHTATTAPTIAPTIEPLISAEIPVDTPLPVDGPQNEELQSELFLTSGNKYVLVDISEQHMYVYDGDVLVNNFVASTGINNGTRVGSFSVLDKIPNAYGATWDLWMPNWLGIYWSGSLENGIHALPILSNGSQLWSGYLGTPVSFGCVVLGVDESKWLYDWVDVGTPVDIQW
jgi:lipoprotein-anchoring transpeptidase ErfK/SrfK